VGRTCVHMICCMYVCVMRRMCVCQRCIHIHIHIHIYIYIYIYIYICRRNQVCNKTDSNAVTRTENRKNAGEGGGTQRMYALGNAYRSSPPRISEMPERELSRPARPAGRACRAANPQSRPATPTQRTPHPARLVMRGAR